MVAMGGNREWELRRDDELVVLSPRKIDQEEDREEEEGSIGPPVFVSRRCRSWLCVLCM